MSGRELIIDSFAGGGGASLGISWALGRAPDVAINHDAAAIAMHAANHPGTRHFAEDVWKVSPRKVTGGRPVGLLWASPDCKHFSRAKGSKPVEKNIRSLAWVVVKWAVESKPRVIILENVREFEEWGPLIPLWACGGCDWKGTEGQATLGRAGRRCPRCDSKRLTRTGRQTPDPERKGLTFKRFVGRLRNLGYAVEWRNLNAADYGAPTHRRRLFLVARNDGAPIVWPGPTHADPRKAEALGMAPWRTAAECIDWSVPCPSIFERKRPLAPATMRRIALGIKRYVIDNPRPFITTYYGANKPSNECRGSDIGEPLRTITTENRYGVVSPSLIPLTHHGERRPHGAGEPLPTVTGANRGEWAVVAPYVVRGGQTNGNGMYANAVEEPLTTITSKAEHMVVAPTLVQMQHENRARDVEEPLTTITTQTNKQALVAAYLAKHYGGQVGVRVDAPLPTTTHRGTQTQLVAANLVHLNHGDKQWSDLGEPARTITGGGNHAALVYSFLTKYFGTAIGADLFHPMPTQTTKDRLGVCTVTVGGEPYVIADIGMRMLTPRELARGQGFPDDYVLTGSKTNQVARIGNSVAPLMAKVLAEANCAEAAVAAAG